jgi:ABC-type bacteriocin/lantibiotic exporter with double-glycine peptidase domain
MRGRPVRPAKGHEFGWHWIFRTLWIRKTQMVVVALTTGIVYGASIVPPVLTQRAIDMAIKGSGGWPLLWLGVAAFAAVLVEAGATSARQSLLIELGVFLDRRVARNAFANLMRMRLSPESGWLINRFQQITKIRRFVLQTVPQVVFSGGNAVVALALMFYYDSIIGGTAAAIVVGGMLLIRRRLGRYHSLSEGYFSEQGKRQTLLSETIAALEAVKSLALERERLRRWAQATNNVVARMRDVSTALRQFQVVSLLIGHMLTLLVLAIGCYRVLHHQLSVGELLALQLAVARVSSPLLASGDAFRQFQEVNVAVEGLRDLFLLPEDRAAQRPAVRRMLDTGISVRNLTMRYSEGARPALDNVSFTLPARGFFAVIGKNGSGKTSLMRVLLGLQRTFEGQVTVGGHDVTHYDPRWFRARIGVVHQETVLLSGSLRDNITSGMSGIDDAEIHGALALVGAGAFVHAKGGLDAAVHVSGRNFSGGQRQRLSIARAVLRDPRIVLLDEPTAFLDSEAAVALEQALVNWGRDRLVIMVSHHLAATRRAEQILLLDGGRLIGMGSHEALLATSREYVMIWNDYTRRLDSGDTATQTCFGERAQKRRSTEPSDVMERARLR